MPVIKWIVQRFMEDNQGSIILMCNEEDDEGLLTFVNKRWDSVVSNFHIVLRENATRILYSLQGFLEMAFEKNGPLKRVCIMLSDTILLNAESFQNDVIYI